MTSQQGSISDKNSKNIERGILYFIAVLVSIIGYFTSASFSDIHETNTNQNKRIRSVEKEVELNSQAINNLIELNQTKLNNLKENVNRLESKIDYLIENREE